MSFSFRPMMATVLLAASGLSFVASAAPRKATNEELRIGTNQEFENFNPLISSMSATTYMISMMDRSRSLMDENNKWMMQTMESVPTLENGGVKKITENGQEKTAVTYTVKKEVVWGDGKPLTGEDYKFSWEVARNENVSVADRDIYDGVERVEIDPANPKKFTLVYKKTRWDYFQQLFHAIPKHLEEPVYKQYGSKSQGYDQNSKYTTDPTNPGLYNGPYRVKEIKLGSHVELIPNEKWWGAEKPKVKRLLVKLIPNTGTLEANILSGEIDMTNQQGLTLDQALEFEKKTKAEKLPVNVVYQDGVVYEHIDFNLENPMLKDAKVRKAIIHAIDRESMVKALFQGKQKVAHHFINPIDAWYTNDAKYVSKYEFSQRKARKLLDEAGFAVGADGIRQKDGKRFTLQFMTTAGNKVRENVQVFIKDQLKAVGIEVSIKNEPPRVFFGETTRQRKYEALAMYAWSSTPENNPRSTFHSSSIPTAQNSWAGQNQMSWINPKVDKALEAMDSEFDPEKRKVLAAELIREYTNDAPVIPLYYRVNIVTVPANIANFKVPAHQFMEGVAVEKWNLK
jgi:peptide/nickel transport system substrate-binding protein